MFSDHVNNARPEHHKLAGLEVKTSNLCSEITLPTGMDHLGNERTAVCCLCSLNLENWAQWEDEPMFIEDIMRFLDNVLQDFIDRAPPGMEKAKYAAMRERSVGLGVMGFHSFLQALNVPWESVIAKVWNKKIFKHIRAEADAASVKKYYSGMNDALRVYLNRSMQLVTMERTNEELILQLSNLEMQKEAFTHLAATLRMSDFVKFAKYIPDVYDNERNLEVIRSSILLINEIRK